METFPVRPWYVVINCKGTECAKKWEVGRHRIAPLWTGNTRFTLLHPRQQPMVNRYARVAQPCALLGSQPAQPWSTAGYSENRHHPSQQYEGPDLKLSSQEPVPHSTLRHTSNQPSPLTHPRHQRAGDSLLCCRNCYSRILNSRAVCYIILIRNEYFGMLRFENLPKKRRPQLLVPRNVLQDTSGPVHGSKDLAPHSPNRAQCPPRPSLAVLPLWNLSLNVELIFNSPCE